MLTIKNLSIYMTKDLRLLLDRFSFSLQSGQKAALIGEEGNGKSTLLRAVAEPETMTDYAEIKGEINRADEVIAYLPQILPEHILAMSTRKYLEQTVQWSEFDYALYYQMLDEMAIAENLISDELSVRQLSGGEKIKFLLFAEILRQPTILLLDEPSNDLDLDAVIWLEQWIRQLKIGVLFVSHDEQLLERCADTIIHLEQLSRKSKPQYTIARLSYSDYLQNRNEALIRQTCLAKKEKAEHDAKLERYRRIYERVQHELRSVSRQDPGSAKNLKDKMRSVKATGKRFAAERENMTQKPDAEESILVRFGADIRMPSRRKIVDLSIDQLRAGERLLSRKIKLEIYGPQKICITGKNGSGKTTLLRRIIQELESNHISYGYMPQDYSDLFLPGQNAVDFLTRSGLKEEQTRIRTYLGSVKFTEEEMFRPVEQLSGGQRAKLYFTQMILNRAEVLVLDEPTRNLSPLSGPEVREALQQFGGCIIAVSHDRRFIGEVFEQILLLDEEGLHPTTLLQ